MVNITQIPISTDQKYLQNFHIADSDGIVPDELSAKLTGNLNHLRWLMTADGLLLFYVISDEPIILLRSVLNGCNFNTI